MGDKTTNMVKFALSLTKSIFTGGLKMAEPNKQGVLVPETVHIYGDSTKGLTPADDMVDIVIDKNVRTKYKDGWINKLRKNAIKEVVIHGTAGGESISGMLHWMFNWGRAEYKNGVGLFHYLIGRGEKGEKDGLIVEVIDPEYFVYHSTSYKNDWVSIGVELINPSKSNRDPYTDAQYDALFKLIFDHLFKLYPAINRIVGHRYNIWKWNSSKTAKEYDKNCPGSFEWSKLDQYFKRNGYSFDSDGEARINIQKQSTLGLKKAPV